MARNPDGKFLKKKYAMMYTTIFSVLWASHPPHTGRHAIPPSSRAHFQRQHIATQGGNLAPRVPGLKGGLAFMRADACSGMPEGVVPAIRATHCHLPVAVLLRFVSHELPLLP